MWMLFFSLFFIMDYKSGVLGGEYSTGGQYVLIVGSRGI